MDKTLIIMRGLPSCGKSYRAEEISKESEYVCAILSTDDFFKWGKRYVFDRNELGAAHKWNQNRCVEEMRATTPLIIIDNTNVCKKDYQFYLDCAAEFNYATRCEYPTSPWWKEVNYLLQDKPTYHKQLDIWSEKLAERSSETHNVPAASIRNMMNRWEN